MRCIVSRRGLAAAMCRRLVVLFFLYRKSIRTSCTACDDDAHSHMGPHSPSCTPLNSLAPYLRRPFLVVCCATVRRMMNLSIDAQKGFSYSAIDEATVCQKKNHIQVRVDVSTTSNPIAVSVPEGGQVAVSRFSVELKGIKMEAHGPAAVVSIEQSMADRSKIAFPGLPFELSAACKARLKVGRLHFSETTANNVRKKGKPNPDQRYFSLCVGIHALAVDGRTFVVQQQTSGRIIVRASNPAQFEGEGNLHWVQGSAASDVVHRGRVGINTDKPNEALVRANPGLHAMRHQQT